VFSSAAKATFETDLNAPTAIFHLTEIPPRYIAQIQNFGDYYNVIEGEAYLTIDLPERLLISTFSDGDISKSRSDEQELRSAVLVIDGSAITGVAYADVYRQSGDDGHISLTSYSIESLGLNEHVQVDKCSISINDNVVISARERIGNYSYLLVPCILENVSYKGKIVGNTEALDDWIIPLGKARSYYIISLNSLKEEQCKE
jgi:hypothetical protein